MLSRYVRDGELFVSNAAGALGTRIKRNFDLPINAGSHEAEVKTETVLHAFELYEHVSDQLIGKHQQAMAKLADSLIASKGFSAKKK